MRLAAGARHGQEDRVGRARHDLKAAAELVVLLDALVHALLAERGHRQDEAAGAAGEQREQRGEVGQAGHADCLPQNPEFKSFDLAAA